MKSLFETTKHIIIVEKLKKKTELMKVKRKLRLALLQKWSINFMLYALIFKNSYPLFYDEREKKLKNEPWEREKNKHKIKRLKIF